MHETVKTKEKLKKKKVEIAVYNLPELDTVRRTLL